MNEKPRDMMKERECEPLWEGEFILSVSDAVYIEAAIATIRAIGKTARANGLVVGLSRLNEDAARLVSRTLEAAIDGAKPPSASEDEHERALAFLIHHVHIGDIPGREAGLAIDALLLTWGYMELGHLDGEYLDEDYGGFAVDLDTPPNREEDDW